MSRHRKIKSDNLKKFFDLSSSAVVPFTESDTSQSHIKLLSWSCRTLGQAIRMLHVCKSGDPHLSFSPGGRRNPNEINTDGRMDYTFTFSSFRLWRPLFCFNFLSFVSAIWIIKLFCAWLISFRVELQL